MALLLLCLWWAHSSIYGSMQGSNAFGSDIYSFGVWLGLYEHNGDKYGGHPRTMDRLTNFNDSGYQKGEQ